MQRPLGRTKRDGTTGGHAGGSAVSEGQGRQKARHLGRDNSGKLAGVGLNKGLGELTPSSGPGRLAWRTCGRHPGPAKPLHEAMVVRQGVGTCQ